MELRREADQIEPTLQLDEMPVKRSRSTTDRRICPHCDTSVSKRTYYRHKQLFYEVSSNSWTKDKELDMVDYEEDYFDDTSESFVGSLDGKSNVSGNYDFQVRI